MATSNATTLFGHPVYLAEIFLTNYFVMTAEITRASKQASGAVKLDLNKAAFIRVEDAEMNTIANMANMEKFKQQFKSPGETFPIISSITNASNMIRGHNASSNTLERICILTNNIKLNTFKWFPLKEVIEEDLKTIRSQFISPNRTHDICVANYIDTELIKCSSSNVKNNKQESEEDELEEAEEEYLEDLEEEEDDVNDSNYFDEQNEKVNSKQKLSPPTKKRRIDFQQQFEQLHSKISEMHSLLLHLTETVNQLQTIKTESSQSMIESILFKEKGATAVEVFKKCIPQICKEIETQISAQDEIEIIAKRRELLKEGLTNESKLYFISRIERTKKESFPILYEIFCTDEKKKKSYESAILDYLKTNHKNFYAKYSK